MESDNDVTTKSTMGGGIRQRFRLTADSSPKIELPAGSSTTGATRIFTPTHPFLLIPGLDSSVSIYYGVERAFNETTQMDVISAMTKTSNQYIYFDPTYVTDGDIIDLTVYTNYPPVNTEMPIQREWIEQFYRHAGSMDRIDFGNYTPPFKWAMDQSSYSDLTFAFHQRLFYSYHGWVAEKSRVEGQLDSCFSITPQNETILSWDATSSKNIGQYIGDAALNSVYGDNDMYTVQPIPFYITGFTFYCKMKNTNYDIEKGAAIKLTFDIDGNSSAIGSKPGYRDSDEILIQAEKFGDNDNFIMSFSSVIDYSSLTPAYSLGESIGGEEYGVVNRKLGIVRASSIKVSAMLLGDDPDYNEIDKWYLTISGYITMGY